MTGWDWMDWLAVIGGLCGIGSGIYVLVLWIKGEL